MSRVHWLQKRRYVRLFWLSSLVSIQQILVSLSFPEAISVLVTGNKPFDWAQVKRKFFFRNFFKVCGFLVQRRSLQHCTIIDRLIKFITRFADWENGVFSPVKFHSGKTSSNKLQKLQNRAAQVITSSSYDADVDSLFHKLSWEDLNSQRQI